VHILNITLLIRELAQSKTNLNLLSERSILVWVSDLRVIAFLIFDKLSIKVIGS
jgi:hypothetical protein